MLEGDGCHKWWRKGGYGGENGGGAIYGERDKSKTNESEKET